MRKYREKRKADPQNESRRKVNEQATRWLLAPFQFRFPQQPLRPAHGASSGGWPDFGLFQTGSRLWEQSTDSLPGAEPGAGKRTSRTAPSPGLYGDAAPSHSRVAAETGSWSSREERLLSRFRKGLRKHLSLSATSPKKTQGPRQDGYHPHPCQTTFPGPRIHGRSDGTPSTRGSPGQGSRVRRALYGRAGWDSGRRAPKAGSRGFYSTRYALRNLAPAGILGSQDTSYAARARRITDGGRCRTRGPGRTHKTPWGPKPSLQPPPPRAALPCRCRRSRRTLMTWKRPMRLRRELRGNHLSSGQSAAAMFGAGSAWLCWRRGPSRARLAPSAAGEAAQQPNPPAERQRYFRCVPGHHPLHRERSPEAAALIGATAHASKKAFPPSPLGPRVRPARRLMSLSPQGPAVPRCPQD